MFGVNDTVARNSAEHALKPAIYTPPRKWEDRPLEAEGGFKSGERVVIDNPDDFYHGQDCVVAGLDTERTVFVAVSGHTFRYCVSSLRHS